MSNVESSLTAAVLLWEKLAPNGVMVFVEPGTPDGFSSLRSIRSMLLECCPPRAMKERCKKTKQHVSDVEEMIADGDWQDECHIIAPCTHNDTCPMSRHQRKHIKRNTRFGKFETAESLDEKANNDDISAQNILGGGSGVAIAALGDSQSEKEAALRELLGEGEDISEEDLQSMLDVIESMGEGAESTDEEEEEEQEEEEFEDDGDFYDIDETLISSGPSTTDQTNVFDTSFCSFVHNFPGGTSRKRGEKFSYLVVQKRVSDSSDQVDAQQGEISLKQVDVVDLLSQSVYHAQRHKEEYLKERLSRDDGIVESSYHEDSSLQILQQAVDLEDEYLDSADDSLGLELLHGERRRGWGRLIRAPLKRKGHVLLDYCSAGGCSKKCGQIIRQKVSRGWSARVAPGCYSAARKARWGGLWPDLNGRINEVKRKELMKRQDES
jgi:ribosomal protein RSM22 (predicted rRNA methylase)